MPKHVDHERRRRELADAVCRVVAREGLEATSLRLVAAEAGWSISSMRYYFGTKAELLAFALAHVADRIGDRLRGLPPIESPLARVRAVAAELLPLDALRREEHLVWLAFTARAAVDSDLAGPAGDVRRRMHEPLAALLRAAAACGELPRGLDLEREATRLEALLDGLALQLAAPSERPSAELAEAVLDGHLAGLSGAGSAAGRTRGTGRARTS